MVGQDPVQRGFVASLARPGGNATGVNIFVQEVAAKRLAMLHRLVPSAIRIVVLNNPTNGQSDELLREVEEAARALALQINVVNASTSREIDAVFAGFAQDRPDALFVANDPFFQSRAAQFATLTARDRIPAAYHTRELVTAGGLMSYGTDMTVSFRQIGIYTGAILKGAKPADLPVVQTNKFEFLLNLQTARALGIEVSPTLLAITDEVIE
jgi:putative tryptophan/tyrosine transport system substrate-binding protein